MPFILRFLCSRFANQNRCHSHKNNTKSRVAKICLFNLKSHNRYGNWKLNYGFFGKKKPQNINILSKLRWETYSIGVRWSDCCFKDAVSDSYYLFHLLSLPPQLNQNYVYTICPNSHPTKILLYSWDWEVQQNVKWQRQKQQISIFASKLTRQSKARHIYF